jgi:hypothetical protein
MNKELKLSQIFECNEEIEDKLKSVLPLSKLFNAYHLTRPGGPSSKGLLVIAVRKTPTVRKYFPGKS